MDMDNHPIPQDVSHFQFKLIGEMTIKQFGYLAGGFVMAWIFFSLPVFILIKLPFALLYAGTGITLAFIPIGGRPADTMIKNFARALFSANQYVFKKQSADPVLSTLLKDSQIAQRTTPLPAAVPLQPAAPSPEPVPDRIKPHPAMVPLPTSPVLSRVTKAEAPQTVVTPPPQITPILPSQETSESRESTREEKIPDKNAGVTTRDFKETEEAEKLHVQSENYNQAHKKVGELEEQLQKAALQKQQLEQELLTLKQNLEAKQQQNQIYSPSMAVPQQESTHVRKIPKAMGVSIGMPSVPDVPNLITGIIKDSRGNVLPGILIEVKDNEGNPVRAFKTNQLGQFASATPLLNGNYTVFFEDPAGKHTFDTVEISATGDIMLPIEIVSIDQREELRKELFG